MGRSLVVLALLVVFLGLPAAMAAALPSDEPSTAIPVSLGTTQYDSSRHDRQSSGRLQFLRHFEDSRTRCGSRTRRRRLPRPVRYVLVRVARWLERTIWRSSSYSSSMAAPRVCGMRRLPATVSTGGPCGHYLPHHDRRHRGGRRSWGTTRADRSGRHVRPHDHDDARPASRPIDSTTPTPSSMTDCRANAFHSHSLVRRPRVNKTFSSSSGLRMTTPDSSTA